MTTETAFMNLIPDAEKDSGTGSEVDVALSRARAGDRAAFEALIRRHERLVFGTARHLLGAVEDAEDAAQEVFLRLFSHLARLDPKRPLGAWLYRVTVNVCRTAGRRRRVRPAALLGDAVEALLDDGSGPSAAVELEEERRIVKEGLGNLPPRERATLALHDIEGLSTREVASALEVSEVTVRTHLCRARLKMRSFREHWYRRIRR